ncbi:hypothetical protein [Paenibacillus ginsengarvi]|uniref:hypothetical protein n=1 Tax=Paenibacillus ginsengarvi TaxID=400777 RepID=UPI001F01806A|nr:hypothetical protein [Paenibacillus ginsengarvi]
MKTAFGEMKLVGMRVVCPGDQSAIEIPKAVRTLKENTVHKALSGLLVLSGSHLSGLFVANDE